MELHDDSNKASTTHPAPPNSIEYPCLVLAKNRLDGLCIPRAHGDRSMPDYVTRITIIMIKSRVTKLMVIMWSACCISCTTKSEKALSCSSGTRS